MYPKPLDGAKGRGGSPSRTALEPLCFCPPMRGCVGFSRMPNAFVWQTEHKGNENEYV